MKRLLAASILVLLAAPASAQHYDRGLAAYARVEHAVALREWRPPTEPGGVSARYRLGGLPLYGLGAPLDDAETVKRFRLAAKQSSADTESNRYYMYHHGQGVSVETIQLYRLAAQQGVARAQSNLGYMHFSGQGVAQDYVEAAKWFRLAAEQGHADAQNNLGYMYIEGLGVRQDDGEAVTWYRRAAEQGVAIAQTNLGRMYFEGRGKLRDYVQAHMWFILAAAQGDEKAVEDREIVAGLMSPNQIAEAERLAREWLQQHPK